MKKLRALYLKVLSFSETLIRTGGRAEAIALGFAIGIFIGMTPWMGFHILSALLVSSVTHCNKLSAIAGVNITNPLTAPMVYALNYWIGVKITGKHIIEGISLSDFSLGTAWSIMTTTPEILWILTVGGAALGLPLAIGGYFLTFSIITRTRKKRLDHPSMA